MKLTIYYTLLLTTTSLASNCGQRSNQTGFVKSDTTQLLSRQIIVSDGCDGCDLMYQGLPSLNKLSWITTIAGSKELGEKMVISGTVNSANGTPAPNIILYVYQTDAKGYYSPSDNQIINTRHGHLRGWMITDKKGQYTFTTVRPGAYPGRDIPAHIHPIIKESGKIEYYIDDYLFDDDLRLTAAKKNKLENRGGSGIIHLTKNKAGDWIGFRDITLG